MTADASLHPIEQSVILLDELGRSIEQIARELDLTRSRVAQTINRYSFRLCWADGDRAERAIREGDRLYRAALAATGKSYA